MELKGVCVRRARAERERESLQSDVEKAREDVEKAREDVEKARDDFDFERLLCESKEEDVVNLLLERRQRRLEGSQSLDGTLPRRSTGVSCAGCVHVAFVFFFASLCDDEVCASWLAVARGCLFFRHDEFYFAGSKGRCDGMENG